MYNGKRKAVTFSFDDGITQDRRLIAILNKYGLKSTFNINSGLFGLSRALIRDEMTVAHVRPRTCEIADIYKGHEIAAHTLTHPNLTRISDDEVIKQVEEDRLALSEVAGYEVVGFAYPGGGVIFNSHVAEIIRDNTGIKYCRTDVSSFSLCKDTNLFEFKPTVHCPTQFAELEKLTDEFLADESDKPLLLYIWGHAYEFDHYSCDAWEKFESYCKKISGHDDIFYGTNREVLLP